MTPRALDRLTIIARKMVERDLVSKGDADLVQEKDGILKVPAAPGDTNPRILMASIWEACYIAALNAALWERENRIRELGRLGSLEAIGTLALQIAVLNDLRAARMGEEKFRL